MSEVEQEYKRLLRQASRRVRVRGTVWEMPERSGDLTPDEFTAWVSALDTHTPVRSHKQRPLRSAGCYEVNGLRWFVKIWKHAGVKNKLKQAVRPGKGRDTWAKGLALEKGGWSTPKPIGFAEQCDRWGMPLQSVFIAEYWEDAVNARHWLRRHYAGFSPEEVARVGGLLRELWVSMRDQRVYHADYKLYNLMVRQDANVEDVSFGLIDVDAIRIGRPVSYRETLRNLIQLNGSLGGWVKEADRRAWLNEFQKLEGRVRDSDIPEIERVTHDRLVRELERIDGP